MKTGLFISIALCCIFSNLSISQCKLDIEVTGLRNKNGALLMELYDAKHQLIKQAKVQITNKSCTISYAGLKQSKYAIRYVHDENGNLDLDKNFLGVPTEGYGFSNNVLAKFGPPDFDKWIFEVKGDTKLKLNIKYH